MIAVQISYYTDLCSYKQKDEWMHGKINDGWIIRKTKGKIESR